MRGRRTPDSEIAQIIGGVAAEQESAAPAEPNADITKLAERLDLLVADFGRWSEYKAAATDYIEEFTIEARWHRRIRLAVAIACALIAVGFAALLIVVLIYAKSIFGDNPGHALTALIVGCLGGIVIVAIAALKGAFSTVKDRNEGLPMPEHIKQLVEVGQNLFGKS